MALRHIFVCTHDLQVFPGRLGFNCVKYQLDRFPLQPGGSLDAFMFASASVLYIVNELMPCHVVIAIIIAVTNTTTIGL